MRVGRLLMLAVVVILTGCTTTVDRRGLWDHYYSHEEPYTKTHYNDLYYEGTNAGYHYIYEQSGSSMGYDEDSWSYRVPVADLHIDPTFRCGAGRRELMPEDIASDDERIAWGDRELADSKKMKALMDAAMNRSATAAVPENGKPSTGASAAP
jgi:hypothetical protein